VVNKTEKRIVHVEAKKVDIRNKLSNNLVSANLSAISL